MGVVALPWVGSMAILAAAAASGDGGLGWPPSSAASEIALLVLASYLGLTAGYAVNDAFDFGADMARGGRPDKAISLGAQRRHLAQYAALLGAPSLVIMLYLGPTTLALATAQMLCVVAYSAWAKARTRWSNLLVVAATALMPLTVFSAFGQPLAAEAVALALVNAAFEPGFTWAGVARDVERDRARGVPTVPVAHGMRATARLVLASWAACAALGAALAFVAGLGAVYLAGSSLASVWLLAAAARFARDPTPARGGSTFLRATVWFWAFGLSIVVDVALGAPMAPFPLPGLP